MATHEGGNKEFLDFLKRSPTLDELNADESTELSGVVTRAADGKFALTTADGQTYELDPAGVQRFRTEDSPGLQPVVTLRISAEAFKAATIRAIKPVFKELTKDPIKDIIHDHHGTIFAKDVHTDPITDKPLPKDIHTDPLQDKNPHKDFVTDPVVDKKPFKDIRKDPIQDPLDTGWADQVGKPTGDPVDIPDPAGQVVNPGFAAAAAQPFVMQTPHHAASHLVAQQMGAPYAAAGAGAQLKTARLDTIKEVAYAETVKEPVTDTRKEMVFDTRKEMVWDTWVEGGPYTLQEGVFDPGQVVVQPEWGAGFGGVRQF